MCLPEQEHVVRAILSFSEKPQAEEKLFQVLKDKFALILFFDQLKLL
jgi:hypothetical protein